MSDSVTIEIVAPPAVTIEVAAPEVVTLDLSGPGADLAAFYAANAEASSAAAAVSVTALSALDIETASDDPAVAWGVTDSDDNLALAVFSDGTAFVAGQDDKLPPMGLPTLLHGLILSQSLGEGSESFPVISTADTGLGNYRFSRGVRSWVFTDNASLPANRAGFSLVPLTAQDGGSLGETCANGLADGLKARLTNPFGFRDVSGMAPHVLISCPSRGGLRLTGLNKEDTGNTYVGTSTTSIAVGTGSKTVTTQTGLTILVGDFMVLASPTGYTPFMAGLVTAYNSGTGSLTFNVSSVGFTSGSGTFADWRITRDYTSFPGGYYPTMLDDVTRGKAAATAEGWTYGAFALFMQGERNADGKIYEYDAAASVPSVYMASYATKLKQYATDVNTDAGAITGQAVVPFFTYQTAAPLIAQAQLDAVNTHANMWMVGPHYHMPRASDSSRGTGEAQVWGDPVHLHSDGERWFGEMVAKVLDRLVRSNEDWSPLQPLAAKKIDANTFDVTFRVPRGPLVLDTAWFGKVRGWGFILHPGTVDAPGTGVEPTGAEVVAPNKIRFTTTTAIPAGAKLWGGSGVPYDIGTTATVASVGVGSATTDGFTTHTITLTTDITATLAGIANHGSFTVDSGVQTARIRSVATVGSVTVLTGEVREKTGTFAAADVLSFRGDIVRLNLRDSDDALALNSFNDTTYTSRSGRYPLHNWCALFAAFPIEGA